MNKLVSLLGLGSFALCLSSMTIAWANDALASGARCGDYRRISRQSDAITYPANCKDSLWVERTLLEMKTTARADAIERIGKFDVECVGVGGHAVPKAKDPKEEAEHVKAGSAIFFNRVLHRMECFIGAEVTLNHYCDCAAE